MKDLNEMTAAELAAEHDRLCDPGDRIGGRPWKRSKAELAERVERLTRDAGPLGGARTAGCVPESAEDASDAAAEPDTVGALVEAMLTTDASYGEIVSAVRERFPEARTTRRSVASVASAMRRRGAEVPLRRRRTSLGKIGISTRKLTAATGS